MQPQPLFVAGGDNVRVLDFGVADTGDKAARPICQSLSGTDHSGAGCNRPLPASGQALRHQYAHYSSTDYHIHPLPLGSGRLHSHHDDTQPRYRGTVFPCSHHALKHLSSSVTGEIKVQLVKTYPIGHTNFLHLLLPLLAYRTVRVGIIRSSPSENSPAVYCPAKTGEVPCGRYPRSGLEYPGNARSHRRKPRCGSLKDRNSRSCFRG